MGKLRIKQIHQFATEVASAINADLAGAGVTAAVSVETSRAFAAEGANAGAISTEKSRALLAEGVVAGNLSDYETSNDTALSTEKSRAVLAEGVITDAVSTEKSRALLAEGVIAGDLSDYETSNDAALSNAISTEVLERNTAIDVLDADLQGQLDVIAGLNDAEVIATFVSADNFKVPAAFNMDAHVAVFVNGLQIHAYSEAAGEGFESADGQDFVFKTGYTVDANDHVVVSGRLA